MPLDSLPKVCPGEEWSRGRLQVMCGRMPLSLGILVLSLWNH